jgi:predicted DNA-binding ribbon-helix-helix protein
VKRLIIKRSVVLNGFKTSVSLEDEFWDGLNEIARNENLMVSALVERIAHSRKSDNLSSAIRVFVFDYFRTRAGQKIFSNEPRSVALTASRPPFTGA